MANPQAPDREDRRKVREARRRSGMVGKYNCMLHDTCEPAGPTCGASSGKALRRGGGASGEEGEAMSERVNIRKATSPQKEWKAGNFPRKGGGKGQLLVRHTRDSRRDLLRDGHVTAHRAVWE